MRTRPADTELSFLEWAVIDALECSDGPKHINTVFVHLGLDKLEDSDASDECKMQVLRAVLDQLVSKGKVENTGGWWGITSDFSLRLRHD